MLIFKWEKRLAMGVAVLDEQHQQVLAAMNSFFISHKCGDDLKTIRRCLSFLQQYVQYHFQTEESYQVKSGYPGYSEHQAEHEYLDTQLRIFSVKLEESHYSKETVDAFSRFLHTWISEHILMEDLTFSAHYREYEQTQAVCESQ